MEKALGDYMEQLHRPFEHEERLRELFLQQQEVNRTLDLDKNDTQVVTDETLQKDTTADTNIEPFPTRRTAREQAQSMLVRALPRADDAGLQHRDPARVAVRVRVPGRQELVEGGSPRMTPVNHRSTSGRKRR